MHSNSPDIFISYSRRDKAKVNKVIDKLKQEGFNVWIDREGIESGDKFRGVIANAIEKAKILLFFSSVHSNTSEWTKKEILCASEDHKCVIPLKFDDAKYNSEFRLELIDLDYIDLRSKETYDEEIKRLCRTLRNKLSSDNPELSSGHSDSPSDSKKSEAGSDKTILKEMAELAELAIVHPVLPIIKKLGKDNGLKLTDAVKGALEKLKKDDSDKKERKGLFGKRFRKEE